MPEPSISEVEVNQLRGEVRRLTRERDGYRRVAWACAMGLRQMERERIIRSREGPDLVTAAMRELGDRRPKPEVDAIIREAAGLDPVKEAPRAER